ncbi:phage tail length tape measure family protein [Escherichia coli]|nr:phage tail length tape measure family protein [Escherichia coli]ELH6292100.1 phage tail length tape measure family protein [Escherichia coli]
MSEQVGTLQIDIDLKTKNLLVSQRQTEDALDNIGDKITATERKTKTFNTQLTKTSAAVKTNLSPAIRNASFQIADLATQLQMGGNALQAFAVQGAQLLAGFGTMGAVAGAVLAIAGAIGNSLTDSMDDATDSAERMKEALSSIDAVIGKSTQGVNAFSDSYYEATQNNAIAAAVMKEQAVRALKTLQEETREAGRAITEFSNAGWMKGGDLGTVARELDELGISGNSLTEVLNKLSKEGAYGATLGKQLSAVVEGLGQKYRITEGEAMALYNAMAQFRKNPSSYEAQSLLSILKAMQPATELGRVELEKYIDALLRYSNEALTAEERQTALNEALNAGASAAAIATGEMIIKQLQIKNEKLKGNENADIDLAVAEGKLTKAHHDEIVQLREQNKALEEKKDKEEEAAREQKRAAREAESAAKQAARQAQRNRERKEASGLSLVEKHDPELAALNKRKKAVEDLDAAEQRGLITAKQRASTLEAIDKAEAARKQKAKLDALVSDQDKQKAQIDPVQKIMNEWAVRKQMLIDLGATQSQLRQEEIAHEQQVLDLKWQQWKKQGDINSMIGTMVDNLSNGAGSAFTGLLNGTQSLQESLANVGSTIISSVVGGLVQMGAEWVKQQLIGEAATAAATAKSLAEATTLGSAWATPAYLANVATMGGAGTAGLTGLTTGVAAAKTIGLAGARYNGGAVNGDSMYRVGEHGVPELFQANNGRQYMIPGDNGRIIPGRDIGGGNISINAPINVYPQNGWTEQDSKALQQTIENTAMRLMQRESTRPGGMLQGRRR